MAAAAAADGHHAEPAERRPDGEGDDPEPGEARPPG